MSEEFQGIGISRSGARKETGIEQAVEASIQRLHLATQDLSLGLHTSWELPTRRQQIGTTCFFSGPIQLAEASGRKISEYQLAEAARAQGLLNQGGAVTYDPEKRVLMEHFVYEQTGVRIRHDRPRMPEGQPNEMDLRLLHCITQDGNLALLLYPLPQLDQTGYWNGRGEWVTLYGVKKTANDALFYMTFSGSGQNGIVETLNTFQMAKRLYGVKGGNSEIWAIEVQTHYPEEARQDSALFSPANNSQHLKKADLFQPMIEN